MIELKKPIRVASPVVIISLSFAMKEEISLDDMQMFILRCIKKGLDLQALCEITSFNENVIENILQGFKEQELIISEGNFYILSEVSERLIRYSDWINLLSDSKKNFSFDLLDGNILPAEELCLFEETDCICFKNHYSEQDLESYNLAENIEFMKQNYDLFSNCTDNETENFLSSIIITAKCQGKWKWQIKEIISLPEWPEILSDKENYPSFIRLCMNRVTYSVHSRRFEGKENLLTALKTVKTESPDFLKSSAIAFVNEYDCFSDFASGDFSVCISPVTGAVKKAADVAERKTARRPVLDLKNVFFDKNTVSHIAEGLFEIGKDCYFTERSEEKISFDVPLLPEMIRTAVKGE